MLQTERASEADEEADRAGGIDKAGDFAGGHYIWQGATILGGGYHDRIAVIGAGRDVPTVREATLKLREGVHIAAEAHHIEQILHGHLAAIDEGVRVFVLEGQGRAAERAQDVVRALGELGAETTLVPTEHPVVDIVRFQLLTADLAQDRGIDPDKIRWDEPRWDAARKSYS